MIGPLLAFLLGGAQSGAVIQESWTPSAMRLVPALVVPEETATPDGGAVDVGPSPQPSPATLRPEPAGEDLMPPSLRKAVRRHAKK
jgi:hypothetical protein